MKISYKSISDILSPKEMKNVLGGSGGVVCQCGNGQSVPIENVTSCDEVNCDEKCGVTGDGGTCVE